MCARIRQYVIWHGICGRFNPQAGLQDIRFHDLRHSAATLLLGEGVHPKVVQELLGHSNISMTMDVYSHVPPSMQEDAISRLNMVLGNYDEEGEQHAQA